MTGDLIKAGKLRDKTSIKKPVVTLKRDDSLIDKNYMYIEKFNRYYFINDLNIENERMEINGEVDVLESFKSEILNSEQVATRQETAFNLQLQDDKITRFGESFQVVKKIGTSPFNTDFIDNYDRNFVDTGRYNFAITVTNDE